MRASELVGWALWFGLALAFPAVRPWLVVWLVFLAAFALVVVAARRS